MNKGEKEAEVKRLVAAAMKRFRAKVKELQQPKRYTTEGGNRDERLRTTN